MLMGEFLTAVHHKLPIKVVIYNNSAFGLITLEAESVGVSGRYQISKSRLCSSGACLRRSWFYSPAAGRIESGARRDLRHRKPHSARTSHYKLRGNNALAAFRRAPLSSARSLWSMLVCADIEGAGSGARVPVEVEHNPFVGEVDAGIDERRSGGRY